MRRLPTLLVAPLLCLPSVALASPFAILQPAETPATPETGEPPTQTPEAQEPGTEPTSSKAPDSAPPGEQQPVAEEPPAEEPVPEGPQPETIEEPAEPTAEVTLESEREQQAVQADFNPHGVGARGGIVVVPTWILSGFLASHTNSLCRGGNVGNFAAKRGLLKTDGCNFYVAGEYTYRKSRIFDIVAAVGYQSMKTPEGYWLDSDEWPDSCDIADTAPGGDPMGGCDISAADYTEVNMNLLTFQADFVARYPVVLTPDVEIGIGGGAGIGLGVIFGGVYQTAIGSAPTGFANGLPQDTCQTLDDLKDFTRCTPRYDPEEYNDVNGEDDPRPIPQIESEISTGSLWADCGRDNCSAADLRAFGYRKKQDDVPPVYPIVNLILSTRFIVKDVWGININGGWNTGFYFGGSMQYFFAGKKK